MTLPIIDIITGPTAAGKSSWAIEHALARRREGVEIEIINADSLLVYRHFNIGTAKPSAEELAQVPHHLIDICNPDEVFTAGQFLRATEAAIVEIEGRGRVPIIVGGTAFYLKALLFGIWDAPPTNEEVRRRLEGSSNAELYEKLQSQDATAALRIGGNDRYRLIRALEIIEVSGALPTELQAKIPKEPNPRYKLQVLDRPDAELVRRIAERTRLMLEQGFIAEVQLIREIYPDCRPLGSVGYAQVCDYLDGISPPGRKIPAGIPGLQQEIELATRQLVRRQRKFLAGLNG